MASETLAQSIYAPSLMNFGPMGRFLRPAPPPVGRITSDVIIGMSVTDFTTVGHIAILVFNPTTPNRGSPLVRMSVRMIN